jgi:hypothetical protein
VFDGHLFERGDNLTRTASLRRALLVVVGVVGLGYGLLCGAVWLSNTLTQARGGFIGEVYVMGLPIVTDSPILGWTAAAALVVALFAIAKARAGKR